MNGHAPGSDGIQPGEAPTGVIVGTAKITECRRDTSGGGHYEWHLADVKRLGYPRKQKRQPQFQGK